LTQQYNPELIRWARLLGEATEHLALDLTGATVLTEAGTGVFAASPVLAAAAGASAVFAVVRDSPYGTAEQAIATAHEFGTTAGVDMRKIKFLPRDHIGSGIDIIANVGNVRPIDASMLQRLSPVGVISYMCEAWEYRPGDLDLAACEAAGIPVAGVWEDYGDLGVFRSCGELALKMCFAAGLEVAGNRIGVVSQDRFGEVIAEALEAARARVLFPFDIEDLLDGVGPALDGVVIAEYATMDHVVRSGDPRLRVLATSRPDLVVVQFAGAIPADELGALGLRVFPRANLQSMRMAYPLSCLGPRPALYLNVAGMKVGELLWRHRRWGEGFGIYTPLVQPMAGLEAASR
jgi:hypothetical protein